VRTWEELAAHLRHAWGASDEADGSLCVVVPVEHDGEMRTQAVGVDVVQVKGRPWVRLMTPTTTESKAEAARCLAANKELAVGAFALVDGYLVVQQVHSLAGLEPEDVEAALNTLAEQGVRWRIALSQPDSATSEMYSDLF
jgi:hypothetical protein